MAETIYSFFLPLGQIEKYIDLSFNGNLQHIHIVLPDHVSCYRHLRSRSQALLCYALILSQITSISVCQVILSEGQEPLDESVNLTESPQVVLALKGKQFAHVQRVIFPPLKSRHQPGVKEYLKTELWEQWYFGLRTRPGVLRSTP